MNRLSRSKPICFGRTSLHLSRGVQFREKLLQRLNRFAVVLMFRKDMLRQSAHFLEFLPSEPRHNFQDVPLTVRLSDFVGVLASFCNKSQSLVRILRKNRSVN